MNEPIDRIPDKVEPVDIESLPVRETVTTVEVESTQAEPGANPQEKVRIEEFTITGDALVAKVKELIHQGNIRRIIIKNEEGRPLIEVPLTVGVVGGVIGATLFPVIAALGAIGALVTHLKVVIERRE
jgi:hypothetical protein